MKNILITMGCSFTQGDGCWDYSILKETPFNSRNYNELTDSEKSIFHQKNSNNFLNKGWPSQLQEMLGYDELYNLGKGGASNSESVKILMEDLYYRDFSECNVLLIWMVSFNHRISFYIDGSTKTFPSDSNMYMEYVKSINDIDLDPRFESYFYIKIVKELCDKNNWNFLFRSVDGNENSFIEKYNDYNIIKNHHIDVPIPWPTDEDKISKICTHPNEYGYSDISKYFYNYINDNHPNLISNTPVDYYKKFNLGKSKIYNL